MRTNLDRERTMEALQQHRSKNKAAAALGTSKYTLERHLEQWGETVDFKRGQLIEANREAFAPGDRVMWKPASSRVGYFGLPEGIAPWPVVVSSGPTKMNYYRVKYAGENRTLRAANKSYAVIGTRLFRENT